MRFKITILRRRVTLLTVALRRLAGEQTDRVMFNRIFTELFY